MTADTRLSHLPLAPFRGPLFFPDAGDTPAPENNAKEGSDAPKEPETDKFTIPREEYDRLKELAALAEQERGSSAVAQAARLAFSKTASEEERTEAVINLLLASGYEDEEIEEVLSGEEPETPRSDKRDPRGEGSPQLAREFEKFQQQVEQDKLEDLRERHQSAISEALESAALSELVEGLSQGKKDVREKVSSTLKEDLVYLSRQILSQRRDREGQFQKSWIKDAVQQATKQVVEKARLFGGGSRVGRSAELSPAEDEFLKQPPKKAPKPTDEGGEQALREYADDVLTRAVIEASKGQTSKV